MKVINAYAPAFGLMLLLVSAAVGATVWVVNEINDVRAEVNDVRADLNATERRLTEKINANAEGIAETNARLERMEQRMDMLLDALSGHTHDADGGAVFPKPALGDEPGDGGDSGGAAAQK